jgi:hypothetical protein
LPSGVIVVGAQLPFALGDIEPGGQRRVQLTVLVTPDSNAIEPGSGGWTLPVIGRTLGEFLDLASQKTVRGQVGDSFSVHVLWKRHWAYLPILLRHFDPRADLTVVDVMLNRDDPANLRVVLTNRGYSTAQAFWIDLYLDPPRPPETNEPWTELRPDWYGAAWFVDELAPGASLALTIEDEHYVGAQSRWPGGSYPSGAHTVWVYADSLGGYPWGAVDEIDEANNRHGPVTFTASSPSMNFKEGR